MSERPDRDAVEEDPEDPAAEASPSEAWIEHAEALADWTLAHLVVRRDAQGRHYVEPGDDGTEVFGRCVSYEPLEREDLVDHFLSTTTRQVRAIHVSSADECCRFLVLDVDNHEHDPDLGRDQPGVRPGRARRGLRRLGLSPLLIDGDGGGSFHLWVPLGREVPMREACRLGRWLVRGWGEAGLLQEKQPELFPASPGHASEKRMGQMIRLFGRHHKRPAWGQVWSPREGRFVDGAEAVSEILHLVPVAVDIAAALPADFTGEVRPADEPVSSVRAPGTAAGRFERRRTLRLAWEALDFLSDQAEEYESWVRLGMCLRELGDDGLALFHSFSDFSSQYRPREVEEKWRSFTAPAYGRGLGLGTLFREARELGWDGLDAARSWRQYCEAAERDQAAARDLLGPEVDLDDLADRARDHRFAETCDEARDALAADPVACDALGRRLGVGAAALEALGAGLREDFILRGDVFVGTGRWAWTIPLSSGDPVDPPLTVGFLRIYRDPRLEPRLSAGGRHGLVLPWGHGDGSGPILVCSGVPATARALSRGASAVGVSDATVEFDEVLRGLYGASADVREVVVEPPGRGPGEAWARDLAARLGRSLERPVGVAPIPAGAAARTRSMKKPGGRSGSFTMRIPGPSEG